MATLPIKPLDGADGYLRWKESVLLRLHSVGVAHVLSDEPPPAPAPADAAGAAAAAAAAAAAKKWARDDAVCRGHILYALSDRIFPDYVRHGTARAVWQAVERTYDLEARSCLYLRFLNRFRFEEEGTSSFLEQLAHAEALVATRDPPPSDCSIASSICGKLPKDMATVIRFGGEISMDRIWKYALNMEEARIELEEKTERRLGKAESACVEQELDRMTTGHRHRRR